MDIKKIKEISNYGKELALQQLLKATNTRNGLGKKGDLSGAEKIDKEVIPVFENIYKFFDFENLESILNTERLEEKNKEINKDNFNLEDINKFLEKFRKDNKIDKDFILKQIEIRKKLKGNSGSEVVEKFLKYRLKEYKKIKNNYLEQIKKILAEEEKLNIDLSNSIQEIEQTKILENLQIVMKKYQILLEKFKNYEEEIDKTQEKINSKWTFEIYGTLEEKELLKVYENFFT